MSGKTKKKGGMENETFEIYESYFDLSLYGFSGWVWKYPERYRHRCPFIQSESGRRRQSTDTSNEAQALLDSAALVGSVTDFQEGSFQVMADQTKDNGQTAVGVAPGMESESGMESTTVSYGEDCVFQIANIDINTQAVNLKDASSSDVKKSTSVAVYGETQEKRGDPCCKKC